MVETRRLEQLIAGTAGSQDFPEGRAAIALSGGADSAALALLAVRSGLTVRAIHVDHGTEQSELLRRSALAIGQSLGIEVHVTGAALDGGRFSEDRARRARYRALLSVREPGEWILTGHTRDDQAETVLMNMMRGTGPAGLTGIRRRTESGVARPLLAVARSDLREIALLAGLPFADDPSNDDPRFTRNHVRLRLIPDIESSFNPEIVPALARMAELLGRDSGYLDAEAATLPMRIEDDLARVARSSITLLPRPVADRVIRRLTMAVRPPYAPDFEEMGRIWAVARGETAGAQLSGGLDVRLSGPYLEVRAAGTPDLPAAETDISAGVHRLGGWTFEVVDHAEVCTTVPISPWSAVFPAGTPITAEVPSGGSPVVRVAGQVAWIPGVRRFPVAFYEPGANGYLSVFAREEDGWT